jgi:hypothetical protein
MVALEMRRPPALQHRRPKKSCGGKAAPSTAILPQVMAVGQEAALSAIPHNSAHTGPMSHENTQPDYCAMSGIKEAA